MNRFDRPACTAVQFPLRVSAYDRLHAMLRATALLDAGKELREIERIVFRVRPADDAFEYFIQEVVWRSPEP